VVRTIASTASTSSIIAIASVAPVASVAIASATLLPPTSKQILEESSKLWGGCSQAEAGQEEDDCKLHIGRWRVSVSTSHTSLLNTGVSAGPGTPLPTAW